MAVRLGWTTATLISLVFAGYDSLRFVDHVKKWS